ncbi:Esterase OVCA2 [Nymphon striatum]|nr:Esterase OVCA2 [Nymphon striatum]
MLVFGTAKLVPIKYVILCLHGYRQNAKAFKEKTGSFRKILKKYAEFVIVDAPFRINPDDDTETEDTVQRGWWFNEPRKFSAITYCDTSMGMDESIEFVKKVLIEEGPIDGIMGFSQGAALAAIISSLKAKGESARFKRNLKLNPNSSSDGVFRSYIANTFWFTILVSSFKSRCSLHEDLYSPTIFIPSLHVYGEGDEVVHTDMSEEVCYHFDQPTRLIHPGGHYIPADSKVKQTYFDFFEKLLAMKT